MLSIIDLRMERKLFSLMKKLEKAMILVSVNTKGGMCRVSLTSNRRTICLTKEIDTLRRANFAVFKILAKGFVLLLLKPIPFYQNKI